jgi:hypothetical protein
VIQFILHRPFVDRAWGEDLENRAAVSALLEGVGAESQVGVGGVLPMICSHLSGIFLLSA